MKAILRSGFLALAIMALAVPVGAGPYEDGFAAYQRGNYATALKYWQPLADQGNADAQSKIGGMFARGLGAPQDFVQGYMWLNLAAAQGHDMALVSRDMVAIKMSPDQIAEAQRMEREWMAKHQR